MKIIDLARARQARQMPYNFLVKGAGLVLGSGIGFLICILIRFRSTADRVDALTIVVTSTGLGVACLLIGLLLQRRRDRVGVGYWATRNNS